MNQNKSLPFIEKAKELNEHFGLNGYVGQDWHIVNADSDKLEALTDFFIETNNYQEWGMVFNLIIASLDQLATIEEVKKYWDKIEKKVLTDLDYYINEISYWALINGSDEEDEIFFLTKFMRTVLINILDTSHISVEDNTVKAIKINGVDFLTFIKMEKCPFSFEELADYLISPRSDEEEQLEYQYTNEKGNLIKDYLYITKGFIGNYVVIEVLSKDAGCQWIKVEREILIREFKK